jgi:nucleoside-diphosphate-sugar epimerase
MLGFAPTVSLEEGMKELTDWYFSKISAPAAS